MPLRLLGSHIMRARAARAAPSQDGAFAVGKHYPITVEALTTRRPRDRARAARVMPHVADINWHGLRHTFASRLLRKTHTPRLGQKVLCHASINTTRRHYAHVLNEDVRQAKAPALQKLQGKLRGRPDLRLVA
jgi:site-specific recombinase XerD